MSMNSDSYAHHDHQHILSHSLPPRTDEKIIIRPMQFSDIPWMAGIAASEYFDSDLNAFLCPRRREYPEDLIRRFHQMIQQRFFNPRTVSFVAVVASHVHRPVGYAQFARFGDDAAAHRLVAAQTSIWRTVQAWYYLARDRVLNCLWPDRSVDREAMRRFNESCQVDAQVYWESSEMKARYGNRWHTQSVVVSKPYQRRGIGKRLMSEVLERAQAEGVVVGLGASTDGEKLYSRLGFELRGRFAMMVGEVAGGIMMWTPKKLQ
ncbi:acyl-CoA N-acyltransferase [Lipomyces starkeyi]